MPGAVQGQGIRSAPLLWLPQFWVGGQGTLAAELLQAEIFTAKPWLGLIQLGNGSLALHIT